MSDKKVKDISQYLPSQFGYCLRPIVRKIGRVKRGGDMKNEFQSRMLGTLVDLLSDLSEFKAAMLLLLRYSKQVGSVIYNTRNARYIELYNKLRNIVDPPEVETPQKNKGKALYELCFYYDKGDNSGRVEKAFPIYDINDAHSVRDLEGLDNDMPRHLCEMVLQQMVNRWETHLLKLVRRQYSSNPNLLKNKIELTYEQLLKAQETGDISNLFVDKLVAQALRGGIEDHFKFFKKNKEFGFDFEKCFSEFNALKGVMYHRDVVVHCDGIASERHCKKMQGICSKDQMPKAGSRIQIDYQFLTHSWDIVFAAGCIVSYIMTKRFKEINRFDDMNGVLDWEFVNISFEAMKEGRYYAAQLMLEYALNNVKPEIGEVVLALKVNLALAYKHTNDKKKFREIIDSQDWDTRENDYKVLIAVLRGEFSEAYRLLREICKAKPEYLNCVYDWIVYDELRKDESFEKEMSKIKAFRTFTPRKGKRPILDFNARPTDVRTSVIALFESILKDTSSKEANNIATSGVKTKGGKK